MALSELGRFFVAQETVPSEKELLRQTVRGFSKLAKPVLERKQDAALLFVEKDGATIYSALDKDGKRTGHFISAESFLGVAYGYLDMLGRNPDSFSWREHVETNGVRYAMYATHPGQKDDGIEIVAKHVFINRENGGERMYVENWLCRANPSENSIIIAPQLGDSKEPLDIALGIW